MSFGELPSAVFNDFGTVCVGMYGATCSRTCHIDH